MAMDDFEKREFDKLSKPEKKMFVNLSNFQQARQDVHTLEAYAEIKDNPARDKMAMFAVKQKIKLLKMTASTKGGSSHNSVHEEM